jgi:hypothetical protein
MKHIAMFLNTKTDKPICFLVDRFKFTVNPKEATECTWNGFHLHMFNILTDIYNGNDSGNMTEHEYFHIREDFFNGVKKEDVMPMMITRDNAIVRMRKLKLSKLYEKRQIP